MPVALVSRNHPLLQWLRAQGGGCEDKEHWEPTVEALFRLQTDSECIREAWAVDWMSHGDSAALNAELHQTSDVGTCRS